MNIGGPANQVLLLAKGLAPAFSTLLAAGRPAEREGELTDPDVPVQRVPLVRPVQPVTDLHALTSIRRLISASGPRLVHTHMAKAGSIGRLAVLTSPKTHRPRSVHTFHGHVLEGYFGGAQQQGFLHMERFLARRTDALVAVSPEVRDELLGLGVGRPGQYQVIPLGLDLDRYLGVGSTDGAPGQLRKAIGLDARTPL
ncbi:MAG TPA: glycosyltransferase, partial [Acidimicrobiales bacterium]|nr:glycosyltransferase [Acidimicrobiales bacterium]